MDSEATLAQFNRLVQELLRGTMKRNAFRPWEIQLLLDIETCDFQGSSKRDVLRRYQKAVQKQMDKGAESPMKLSEYLEYLKSRRQARESSPAA